MSTFGKLPFANCSISLKEVFAMLRKYNLGFFVVVFLFLLRTTTHCKLSSDFYFSRTISTFDFMDTRRLNESSINQFVYTYIRALDKRGIDDNSKMIFLFLNENIHCDSSLEPSWRGGSSDDHKICFNGEKSLIMEKNR